MENYEAWEDATVLVRRQWNDHREGRVRAEDLEDLHWSNISGGVRELCPQYFLAAYIWCDAILSGEVAHSCRHGSGPHHIKVFIIKKANDPQVFEQLARRAGPRPRHRKV